MSDKTSIQRDILLLSDEPNVSGYLIEMLSHDLNCNVDFAPNRHKAMEKLEEKTYDCLLVDMWANGGDGKDLLHWVRMRQRREPVVLMSEGADYEMLMDVVNEGAFDLIAKPLHRREIENAIRRALDEEGRPSAIRRMRMNGKKRGNAGREPGGNTRNHRSSPADLAAYRLESIYHRVVELRQRLENPAEEDTDWGDHVASLCHAIAEIHLELDRASRILQERENLHLASAQTAIKGTDFPNPWIWSPQPFIPLVSRAPRVPAAARPHEKPVAKA